MGQCGYCTFLLHPSAHLTPWRQADGGPCVEVGVETQSRVGTHRIVPRAKTGAEECPWPVRELMGSLGARAVKIFDQAKSP